MAREWLNSMCKWVAWQLMKKDIYKLANDIKENQAAQGGITDAG